MIEAGEAAIDLTPDSKQLSSRIPIGTARDEIAGNCDGDGACGVGLAGEGEGGGHHCDERHHPRCPTEHPGNSDKSEFKTTHRPCSLCNYPGTEISTRLRRRREC